MRKLGAFFIKRKLDKEVGKKDHVYRALLHTVSTVGVRGGITVDGLVFYSTL